MNLGEKYNIAKAHKDTHISCGGEPYKSFERLNEVVKELQNVKILEVGTAVGFTTCILQDKTNNVDTIELHREHIEEAKKNIQEWGGDVSKIDFLEGDAKDILPTLEANTYDLIFFDGYGAKLIYYTDFERVLKPGGILITANQHLKSTESEYFKQLEDTNKWKYIEEFADTKIYRKL